jgi:hypothetical protein
MRLLILFSLSILITACGTNRIPLVNKRSLQKKEVVEKQRCTSNNKKVASQSSETVVKGETEEKPQAAEKESTTFNTDKSDLAQLTEERQSTHGENIAIENLSSTEPELAVDEPKKGKFGIRLISTLMIILGLAILAGVALSAAGDWITPIGAISLIFAACIMIATAIIIRRREFKKGSETKKENDNNQNNFSEDQLKRRKRTALWSLLAFAVIITITMIIINRPPWA